MLPKHLLPCVQSQFANKMIFLCKMTRCNAPNLITIQSREKDNKKNHFM